MKTFVVSLLLLLRCLSAASPSADPRNEAEAFPSIEYGTSTGLGLGLGLKYLRFVNSNIQANVGGFIQGNSQTQISGIMIGADYNFLGELNKSVFTGLEVGYINNYFNYTNSDLKWVGVRLGKRFTTLSGSWTYKPYFDIHNTLGGGIGVSLVIINFSLLW
jgi:hypothetical protein